MVINGSGSPLKDTKMENQPTFSKRYTVALQWLEHLWNSKNMFETGIVRPDER